MLYSFLNATPTAELEPITENYVQADEVITFILFAIPRLTLVTCRRIWV